MAGGLLTAAEIGASAVMPPRSRIGMQQNHRWVLTMIDKPNRPYSHMGSWTEAEDAAGLMEEMDGQREALFKVLDWGWRVHETLGVTYNRELVRELIDAMYEVAKENLAGDAA